MSQSGWIHKRETWISWQCVRGNSINKSHYHFKFQSRYWLVLIYRRLRSLSLRRHPNFQFLLWNCMLQRNKPEGPIHLLGFSTFVWFEHSTMHANCCNWSTPSFFSNFCSFQIIAGMIYKTWRLTIYVDGDQEWLPFPESTKPPLGTFHPLH